MRRLEGFSVVSAATLALAVAPGAWGNLILEFNEFGVHGQVEMFDPVVGAPDGAISFIDPGANDISLVFQVTVFDGSHPISEFGVGVNNGFDAITSTGLGWIPDGAPEWVDISGFDGTADTRIFNFDPGDGHLDPGETSDMFFVSYAEGSIAVGDTISFMITNGGPTFSVKTLIPKVPGPGALGLLLLGAAAGRRRRRSSVTVSGGSRASVAKTAAVCTALAVTGSASAQVFQGSVEVEQDNGAYTVTKDVTVCFDPECPEADACTDGRPITITMEYTGGDCSTSSNSQPEDKWSCEDFGALPDTAYIVASKDEDCGDEILFSGNVSVGETYVIDGRLIATWDGGPETKSGGFSNVIQSRMQQAQGHSNNRPYLGFPSPESGDELPSRVFICVYDVEGGTLLQHIEFHASCSQPLFRGDTFGSARVVDSLGSDADDESTACCNGKPVVLTMEYTGNECDTDANTQDDKFDCFVDSGPLPNTVYLVVSEDENCDEDFYFQGEVSIGDTYVIDAAVLGDDTLKSKTFVCIYDEPGGTLLQHVEFHTSCSAPLNFGDGFGGSTLVGAIGEDGECVPPEEPCDPFPNDGNFTYIYKISNHCDSPLGLIGSEIVVDSENVVSAGFFPGDGVEPSGITITDSRVRFEFYDMPILPCEMSVDLYIVSPLGPDTLWASILGMAGLDAPVECIGPAVECEFCDSGEQCFSCPSGPAEGDPCPVEPFDCENKIVEMTMIWGGNQAVRIKAYDGNVGENQIADIDNIQPGDEVTVGPLAGQNDSYWEIFEAGTDNLIGLSSFHRSCSDQEMNDETDCGSNQGNGKNNEDGLINDWILEGLVTDEGFVLDCTP